MRMLLWWPTDAAWVLFALSCVVVIVFQAQPVTKRRLLFAVAALAATAAGVLIVQNPCAIVEPGSWEWYFLGCPIWMD